jgi:N6-adenosine-specific RNA methylase IME4
MNRLVTIEVQRQLAQAEALKHALDEARIPEDLVQIEAQLNALEGYMRDAGLYSIDVIRPVNETRMRARWKLGRLLAEVERGAGPGRGKKVSHAGTSFRAYLDELKLNKNRAQEAQRIGTLPDCELEKAFAEARKRDSLLTFADLIHRARPYWYHASRQKKHQEIREAATAAQSGQLVGPGPFPLILADPPWKFGVYSDKGLDRTPDQHYPTLSDDELKAFDIGGRHVSEIAAKDAALFMWCTSSNIHRALPVMEAWDFEFKASAVWVKDRFGTGLVFRNQHELLLYGTRGRMPGPQYQPPSVFQFPRGRHSEKPAEIRQIIEKMYPDFDARTRIELFAREQHVDGWTLHGFEANRARSL